VKDAAQFVFYLLLALLGIVAAFAVIMGLGWVAVNAYGPALFALLPRPLAYLGTAIMTALTIYTFLFVVPSEIKRAIRWSRRKRRST
jgi:CBS domain containing-hemolysin-like protein